MGIFQNSVLRNTKQDESILAHRWASFQDYLSKIEAIKDFKEEIYQDGFLHDVFEKCLGYTLKTTNPNNYSLDREQKNETDGKKADAAIFIDRNSLEGKASNASLQQTAHGTGAVNDKIVVGVIELKDQKSKNLDVIEAQAFGYHASHANSRYIIISNFDELRFYIDKKSYYEKFNLFNLDFDEFRKLHLILSYESISSGLTNRLLEQSNRFEVDISKKLYSDFSDFRTHLFENIVKNNYVGVSESVSVGEDTQTQTQTHTLLDKQTLLRLTQKLCDRLIFILFAEDRGLLRPNTIKEIREEFKNQKFTSYTLYDIYKFYFDAISSGNERLDIQKYNGGLFAKDELLDSLKIDDEQIDLKAQKLSDYDFMSDIGVNILGHIFEQSLSDIEELNASINDTEFDRKKSKRKKDGVFYTPEYITRYIVENTLGKLCTDKKAELNIIQIEPPKDSRKPTKKEQATKANLEIYRNWLLELKILDPACGSGAFLNQALEFLIREHKSLQQNLVIMGDITAFYDIEEGILEHNLYGVDINEDAVEIAKLSLWLRTAQKGRMLTNLSGKIKCGNSLIDDKNIAQNAFVWEDEFPEVFNQKIFLDTNIVIHGLNGDDATGSKKFLELAKDNNLNCWVSSRTWWEVKDNEENKEKLNFLATVNTGGSNCVFGLSEFGQDFLVTEEHVILNQQIKEIINRYKSSIDCDILQSAVNNGAKYFITHNTKDFIKKDGTRERLEKLTNVRIFTPEEFLEYFAKGSFAKGFDVVIGNPPYGAKLSKEEKEFFYNKYKTIEYQLDTYTLFMEDGFRFLKSNGKLGYIVPSTWLTMFYFKNLRKYLIENSYFEKLILFRYQVFEDVTAETSIITLSKDTNTNKNINTNFYDNQNEVELKPYKQISQNDWIGSYELGFNVLFDSTKLNVISKISTNSIDLDKLVDVPNGIKPYEVGKGIPKQTKDNVKNRIYDASRKLDETYQNYIVGGNINRFTISPSETNWIKFGDNLAAPRKNFNFFQKKIMVRQTSDKIIAAIDYQGLLSLNNVHNIVINDENLKYETLVCVLNSKLMDFYYKFLVPEEGRTFAEVKAVNLKRLPLKTFNETFNQQPFIELVDEILEAKEKIKKYKKHFDTLNAVDKIEITEEIEKLESLVQNNENTIDQMVYKLYGLTSDEIAIIEEI